ncbi:MAG TPA: MBL fold metallo-hydrolase [Flavihumibacter sp.]|jgi:L-ascorbate metabolism protein UlaG (beta-lactamase superfamily)
MKKITIAFFASILTISAFSQVDAFTTTRGILEINPVYHGSFWMKWNNLTILVDPYGGADRFKAAGPADLVLITDIHGDHMDSSTLVNLDLKKATLVVPAAVATRLEKFLPADISVRILNNGDSTEFSGLGLTAIPMYNLPDTSDSRHPKGRGNGYVLNLGDKRVYISGDTEDIPEMRSLQQIDIAFLCMNKPYTMDEKQAAEAALAFKPAVVYPFHFRRPGGFSDVEEFARLVKAGNPGIEVRIRKWY